jgi:hypothetical protein
MCSNEYDGYERLFPRNLEGRESSCGSAEKVFGNEIRDRVAEDGCPDSVVAKARHIEIFSLSVYPYN